MNTQGLLSFIENTPNAYICAENIAKALKEKGFKQSFGEIESDRFYIIKGGSLIAGDISACNGFLITATHSDSPALKLKPEYDLKEKYSVSPYGGLIYSSWFDRPLGLSGRIIVKKGEEYYSKNINLKEPLAVLPSLAIHLNRDINEGHKYNSQTELCPLKIKDFSSKELLCEGEELLEQELYFYPLDKPLLAEDTLLSPRIDDLACVYPALEAFLNTANKENGRILAVFNSEEIGSNTLEGADSSFLKDVLKAACKYKGVDFPKAKASSFLVSADNAHGYHPNYPEKYEAGHKCILGNGIAVKHNINYTTTALSAAVFRDIAKVPLQNFAMRNDMRCGSTLGNISLTHFAVNSVDIGVPMLGMHSANETCNIKDIEYMEKALTNFYKAQITALQEKLIIK